jgi:glycosyltransferase involved in cell wall biosynthesis
MPPRVSVVLPCLDEVGGVVATVEEAREGLRIAHLDGEIIVVDNGSVDGSAAAARSAGARVLTEPRRGYGSAIRRGLEAARGEVVVIADADHSYNLVELGALVAKIDGGADLVLGRRVRRRMDAGAMPWSHCWIGIPLLNALLAVASGRWFRDSQSGYRACRAEPVRRLGLAANGMELATEMLARAQAAGLRIDEAPIGYRSRTGSSKLRPVSDGLRHCRLLLELQREAHGARRTRYVSSS